MPRTEQETQILRKKKDAQNAANKQREADRRSGKSVADRKVGGGEQGKDTTKQTTADRLDKQRRQNELLRKQDAVARGKPIAPSGVLADKGSSEQAQPAPSNLKIVASEREEVEERGVFGTFIDDQKSRFENIGAVFAAIIKNEPVTADIQNRIIRDGLENAVNNPITTVLTYGSGAGLIRYGIAKSAASVAKRQAGKKLATAFPKSKGTKQIGLPGQTVKLANNPKNARLLGKSLGLAGFTVAAAFLIKDGITTFGFSRFQINEGAQAIGMARHAAIEAGRQDLVDALDQLEQEIYNPQGWDKFAQDMPWLNTFNTAGIQAKANQFATNVYKKIAEDKAKQIEEGTTDEDVFRQGRQEREESEDRIVENRLAKQKIFNDNERQAEADGDEEAAKLWRREGELEREREAEDRQVIADFWLEYHKRKQEIDDNNRPSSLNFGLLG